MKREEDKKKWSPQQIVYINQLHLITVMLMLGKVKLVEQGAGTKGITAKEMKESESARTCDSKEAAKIKEKILAYVKTGPPAIGASGTPKATPAKAGGQ